MTIADWIVLGIIIIFVILGFILGFVKMVFTLGKGLITYFIAYIFTKPLTLLLLKFKFATSLNVKILNMVCAKGEIFSQPITEASIGAVGESLNLPSFLSNLVTKALNGALGNLVDSGTTLGQAVSDTLTYYIFMVISFIVLFILALILVIILGKVLEKLFTLPVLNIINRILGAAFGLLLGAFFVSLSFILMDFLSTLIPSICDFVEKNINPTSETFGVARFLYNHNFVRLLFNSILKSKNIVWTKTEA